MQSELIFLDTQNPIQVKQLKKVNSIGSLNLNPSIIEGCES